MIAPAPMERSSVGVGVLRRLRSQTDEVAGRYLLLCRIGLRTGLILVSIAGVVAGGLGCGGAAKPVSIKQETAQRVADSGGASVTVRRQALKSADAVCERGNGKLVTSPPKGARRPQVAVEILANARIEKETVEELRKLAFPASMRSLMGSIEKYREQLAGDLVSLASAFEHDHEAQVAAISSKQTREHSALFVLARRNGLPRCGST